jgi:hypothetical protein
MAQEEIELPRDVDRDSLHILPLCILPLSTTGLKHARLIRNARLESVIEFFEGRHTGSGQLDVEGLSMEFDWPETPPHPDMVLIRKLAELSSYDVYSLRILLRQQDVEVNDVDALKLSANKRHELNEYMTGFTHPLIMEIYGGVDESIKSFDDVLELFKHPDVKKAREKLQTMADKLGIQIDDLPKFLEDYGDIYLSLSYYRQCLDQITPIIEGFGGALADLRGSMQFKENVNLMNTCDMMESTIHRLEDTINDRFESFKRETQDLWDDISAERFERVEDLIRGSHTFIGGILCALSVKMDAWIKQFPHRRAGGMGKRAEFILSEMKLGIEKIEEIEGEALAGPSAG